MLHKADFDTVRGLGRHTKRGASFLVSSVCGGAVGPVILGVCFPSYLINHRDTR